jgi:MYXO-CTERM domain-containing protein
MHEVCTDGNCVVGSGVSDAGADSGTGLHLDGGLNGDASFSLDGSSGSDASSGDDGGGGDTDFGGSKAGCGCHAAGEESGTQGWLAALGIGLAAMAVRRRRTTRPAR